MADEQQTMGEFIEALKKCETLDSVSLSTWLDDIQKNTDEEVWRCFMAMPVTRDNIINLGDVISGAVAYELSILETPSLYKHAQEAGHGLLQEIHRRAVQLGVSVELNEIDVPLTPSESMQAAGLMNISPRGMVSLTKAGEQLVREVEQAIGTEMNWMMSVEDMPHESGLSYPVFQWSFGHEGGPIGGVLRAWPQGILVFEARGEETKFDSIETALAHIDEYGWGKPPYIDGVFQDVQSVASKFPANTQEEATTIFAELREKWNALIASADS